MLRPSFLDSPYHHLGAARTGRSRAQEAYAGERYVRPATWADRVARFVTLALVLGALGLLYGCGGPGCAQGETMLLSHHALVGKVLVPVYKCKSAQ